MESVMTQLNKVVLASLKTNAKNWTLAEQSASELATTMACDIEPFIDAKLKAKRTKHGKLLAEYRDEVDSVIDNVPEITESLKGGVIDGVLEGKSYKDFALEMYDNGVEYLAVDTAKVSLGDRFDSKAVKSFSMGYILAQDFGKLDLTENKEGVNNNPLGSHGPSFKALAKADQVKCKNTIDKAWSRLKGRMAKALATMFGEIKLDVDVLEKATKRSVDYFKSMQSLTKDMSAKDSKAVMAWLTDIEKSYPLGK